MPRLPARLALALLGILVCLAACVPAAVRRPSTAATTPPAPTPAPLALAPTPASVAAGWLVLDTPYFSLAYPPNWTTLTLSGPRYFIKPPTRQSQVIVVAQPQSDVSPYCLAASSGARHTTFARLPMTYLLSGQGNDLRTWIFANAQRTLYSLQAEDAHADAATQAADTALLDTFHPDNAVPWRC